MTIPRDLTAEQTARILEEFANFYTIEGEELANEITSRIHRTLQQRLMGMFISVIEAWAALPEGGYDLRNEATVKLARKIIAATGDKYDRYLPRI